MGLALWLVEEFCGHLYPQWQPEGPLWAGRLGAVPNRTRAGRPSGPQFRAAFPSCVVWIHVGLVRAKAGQPAPPSRADADLSLGTSGHVGVREIWHSLTGSS